MKSSVEPLALLLLRRGMQLDKYILAEEGKCHQRTAQRILRGMHVLKMVYIAGWQMIYKQHIPFYALQTEERKRDKPKPPPTPAMIRARRRRKDPEVRMKEAAAKKAKRQLLKGLPNEGKHL